MNLYLRGGGSPISTTLDSVTERGVACEFFSNQSEGHNFENKENWQVVAERVEK